MVNSAPVAFDARALLDPVDPNDLKRFVQWEKANAGKKPGSAKTVITIVAAIIGGIFALVIIGGISTAIVTVATWQGGSSWAPLLAFLPIVVIIGTAVAIIIPVTRSSIRKGRIRRYRLHHFAAANQLEHVPHLVEPRLPGMIFGVGSGRYSTDLIRGQSPRFIEVGNYTYTTGSGKNQTTHRWGYVAIHLSAPLPHIVLDALGNNSVFGSNLPVSFSRDQRLSLEGNFDDYFALYCPKEYETDALYLFTPDVMARLMDSAAELDVEIVDDWLFLYRRGQLSTTDPEVWLWLFTTIRALLTKLEQWGRWRDDRLAQSTPPVAPGTASDGVPTHPTHQEPTAPPPLGVAPQGRRLSRRWAWWILIPIGVIVLGWLVPLFSALFGALAQP